MALIPNGGYYFKTRGSEANHGQWKKQHELPPHTEEWDRMDETSKLLGLASKTNWTGLWAGTAS